MLKGQLPDRNANALASLYPLKNGDNVEGNTLLQVGSSSLPLYPLKNGDNVEGTWLIQPVLQLTALYPLKNGDNVEGSDQAASAMFSRVVISPEKRGQC